MTRASCKEIIAFATYIRREEMKAFGIEPYGDRDTDQITAETIIKFFEDMKNDEPRSYDWEHRYEEYKMFEGLCMEIECGR